MTAVTDKGVPPDAPDSVKASAQHPREPTFEPTLGIPSPSTSGQRGEPPHRLVVIGDSLSHGFQSGAVFNTDLSYPAIIAHELGWSEQFRYPRYPGLGGLPLNLELMMRTLEERFGPDISGWEVPLALFEVRNLMDKIENHWERGAGSAIPSASAINHCLAMYGWDLRDALERNAADLEAAIDRASDDLLYPLVEHASERAALRVYPGYSDATRRLTLFEAAMALGNDHDDSTESGIDTLVVFLGANNALGTVTQLKVVWSEDNFRDLRAKRRYTAWQPEHFKDELDAVVERVNQVKARHVIWCTVPHVTIAPITRGVGDKSPGSRYFRFYTRPWISDADFDPGRDKHLTDQQARAVDAAIDCYNQAITEVVEAARSADGEAQRDWYLLDIAGLMDRLASRRYIDDPGIRPPWWSEYPLPPQLASLSPVPNSHFLTGDGNGGRGNGGLFSLDGVHPTTVAYGLIAQEMINIMQTAGIVFRHPNGTIRTGPVAVDFDRLIRRDTLVQRPPQNLMAGLHLLGWADETLGWVMRAIGFNIG